MGPPKRSKNRCGKLGKRSQTATKHPRPLQDHSKTPFWSLQDNSRSLFWMAKHNLNFRSSPTRKSCSRFVRLFALGNLPNTYFVDVVFDIHVHSITCLKIAASKNINFDTKIQQRTKLMDYVVQINTFFGF